MTYLKRFAWTDALVAALLLLGGVAAFPIMTSHAPAVAVVLRDAAVIGRYPLSSNADMTVQGVRGPVAIRVRDGKISITSAHCPRHICQHTVPIGRHGQQIVCVPNHVIIEIESAGPKGTVDAVAE